MTNAISTITLYRGQRGPGSIVKNGATALAERPYLKVDGATITATDNGTEIVLALGSVPGNALQIQGRNVAATAPTAGQALIWNGTNTDWEPTTIATGINGKNDTVALTTRTYLHVDGGELVLTDDGAVLDSVKLAIGAASVTGAKIANGTVAATNLSSALQASIARLTAKRQVVHNGATTTSALALTDRILGIDMADGNHTTTLPSVASAAGMDFLLQKTSTGTNSLTLALAGGDTGAKIHFGGNSPVAGASLLLSDSTLTTQPGWTVWSDGTDWWVA